MTRDEFDRILIEEGIAKRNLRDEIWKKRPSNNLDEEKLRKICRGWKKQLNGEPLKKLRC